MNNAVKTLYVCIFVCITKSGISGSPKRLYHFFSHHQGKTVLVSPTWCHQAFKFSLFWFVVVPLVTLMFTPLMINKFEHLLPFNGPIWTFSFVKYLFKHFSHFPLHLSKCLICGCSFFSSRIAFWFIYFYYYFLMVTPLYLHVTFTLRGKDILPHFLFF